MPEHTFNPDLIRGIAQRLQNGQHIVTEAYNQAGGFVLQHTNNRQGCTFVGLQEQGTDVFVVAKMFKKSETIGRNDPKIQTSKNEYVECQLYRMVLDTPIEETDEQVEAIAETIDNEEYEEYIDTGYINGYRLTELRNVLEDTFRWYGR